MIILRYFDGGMINDFGQSGWKGSDAAPAVLDHILAKKRGQVRTSRDRRLRGILCGGAGHEGR